jgi:hypothetical protein
MLALCSAIRCNQLRGMASCCDPTFTSLDILSVGDFKHISNITSAVGFNSTTPRIINARAAFVGCSLIWEIAYNPGH